MRRLSLMGRIIYLAILALGLSYSYPLICCGLGFHYDSRALRYEDAAMELNQQQINDHNVTIKSICEVDRYFKASRSVISDMGFNAYRLIADWNRDFLAEQAPCR